MVNFNDKYIYDEAHKILKQTYGINSEFKEGQYEAIESTLLNKRTLVIQKTGWGKSLIYFIATKIQRNQNKGVTLVISPLVSLMNNQFEWANKIGLKCDIFNSYTKDRHKEILYNLINNSLDLILITPESLFSVAFQNNLSNINIGLFVIDEAHCISDWGHDFRLSYGSLWKVLKVISSNIPILATTATANDRVIIDLKNQLRQNQAIHLCRGGLLRKTLAIQIIKLEKSFMRYAWILENINKLNGVGIIYCLTTRDCDNLSEFLSQNGINSRAYHSNMHEDTSKNYLQLFYDNKIKVLVSTIKLGMGYDKGDVGFIIHYQQPSNIVAYYQQIGRAGRNIDSAKIILMCGYEDLIIQNYFIESAFPTEEEFKQVLSVVFKYTEGGCTITKILDELNLHGSSVNKVLMFLQNDAYITKEGSRYYSNIKEFKYNKNYYQEIKETRKKEQKEMQDFISTDICYNKYLVNALDDNTEEVCGCCSNCVEDTNFNNIVSQEYINTAQIYLKNSFIPILPRKKWSKLNSKGNIGYINLEGICLSKYGEPEYGKLVKEGKYAEPPEFCNELVSESTRVLQKYIKQHNLTAITAVPSLRSSVVKDFAKKLAISCKLEYIECLLKHDAQQQKFMKNSSHQCENALKSFEFIKEQEYIKHESIILVDDIIDSKWTLTVCGELLISNSKHINNVFPFALASAEVKSDN